MDTLIHADIFFFVTTIAVVVVGIAFTIALVYLIQILSDIKKVTGQVQEEAVLVREDIKTLRAQVKVEGLKLQQLTSFFKHIVKHKVTKAKKD